MIRKWFSGTASNASDENLVRAPHRISSFSVLRSPFSVLRSPFSVLRARARNRNRNRIESNRGNHDGIVFRQ